MSSNFIIDFIFFAFNFEQILKWYLFGLTYMSSYNILNCEIIIIYHFVYFEVIYE